MEILSERNGFVFGVTRQFQSAYLLPVLCNLRQKIEEAWDDYNELYHCCRLIERVKRDPDMRMDFHVMQKEGETVGLALVTSGKLDEALFFQEPLRMAEAPTEILFFNYFHIAPLGRGNGERWLKDILRYYQEKQFKAMYVKSSHPRVFSLYRRLGEEIGAYTAYSDNRLFTRQGKIFKIILSIL